MSIKSLLTLVILHISEIHIFISLYYDQIKFKDIKVLNILILYFTYDDTDIDTFVSKLHLKMMILYIQDEYKVAGNSYNERT